MKALQLILMCSRGKAPWKELNPACLLRSGDTTALCVGNSQDHGNDPRQSIKELCLESAVCFLGSRVVECILGRLPLETAKILKA